MLAVTNVHCLYTQYPWAMWHPHICWILKHNQWMIVSKAICGSVKARGECRLWTDNILVTQEDKRGAVADPNKPLNSAPWLCHFVSFPAHLHIVNTWIECLISTRYPVNSLECRCRVSVVSVDWCLVTQWSCLCRWLWLTPVSPQIPSWHTQTAFVLTNCLKLMWSKATNYDCKVKVLSSVSAVS